jgi:Subtilase family
LTSCLTKLSFFYARLSPLASRLSPLASRLSPLASRLSPLASRPLLLFALIGQSCRADLQVASERGEITQAISSEADTSVNISGGLMEAERTISVPLSRRQLSATEVAGLNAAKPKLLGNVPKMPTAAEYLEAQLQSWEARGVDIEVTFDLRDNTTTAERDALREELSMLTDQGAKELAVSRREQAFELVRSPLRQALAALKIPIRATRWLSNQVVVTVSPQDIRFLSKTPGVVGWSENHGRLRDGGSYSGIDLRSKVKINRFINAGWRGCNVGNGCKRLGLLEGKTNGSPPLDNHLATGVYALRKPGSAQTRVVISRDCTVTTCSNYSGPASGDHVLAVAGAAAGSIEGNQDPAYQQSPVISGTTVAQRQRSFVAPDKDIAAYAASSCEEWVTALQGAILDGAWVLSNSQSFDIPNLTMNSDCAGLNANLRNFADFNGLLFELAYNDGPNTMYYPAVRPEVVVIGAVDDGTIYENVGLANYSGYKSYDLAVGGYPRKQFPVQLLAPANLFGLPQFSGGYGTGSGGTSISTPVVAGIAALLRDTIGFSPTDKAWKTQAAMIALGDGFDSFGPTRQSGTSLSSGSGRVFARYPRAAAFGGQTWGWEWQKFSISQGQLVCWNVGNGMFMNGISQWKFGATWDEPTPGTDAADIDFYVYDATSGAQLASQTDYNLFQKFRLPSNVIAGRALQVCAKGLTVPGTRTVYGAGFYHNDGAD